MMKSMYIYMNQYLFIRKFKIAVIESIYAL